MVYDSAQLAAKGDQEEIVHEIEICPYFRIVYNSARLQKKIAWS